MNKLDKDYTNLLKDILENGVSKQDRTGTGTISVFGRQIRHSMKYGFPLLTTKKMYTKGIVTELLWFMMGNTNIKFLVDNDCNIWNGDAFKSFKSKQYPNSSGLNEFEMEDFIIAIKNGHYKEYNLGELGPVYGSGWRNFEGVDQISELIDGLKTNPDSRRLRVSAWQPHKLKDMVLPPCHTDFQVYTRELSFEERRALVLKDTQYTLPPSTNWTESEIKEGTRQLDDANIPTRAISLMWNQRSCDIFLGLPFNIASYGLLLEIIAKVVNMVPDELIGNLGDVHLYSNHVDQALEQIGRYLRVDERVCMCYENPILDLTRIQEGMCDSELEKVCDEFGIPTRTREAFELPKLNINTEFWPTQDGECGVGPLHEDIGILIENMQITDFEIIDYKSHGVIKAPLSN